MEDIGLIIELCDMTVIDETINSKNHVQSFLARDQYLPGPPPQEHKNTGISPFMRPESSGFYIMHVFS